MLPSVRFTSVLATVVMLGGCGGSSLSTSTGPSAVKCATSLTGLPATVPAEGATVRANVSAERECAWNARPEAGWVQVAPATGQGASQVTVVVAANDAAVARSAAIDLNDTRVTLSQAAAACQFELRPRSAQVAQTGGNVQVSITTLQGCSWTVSNQTSWVSPSRTRGSGSGTIELTIAGNSGTARSASLTIAGRIFSVDQVDASGPSPGPSPSPGPTPAPNPEPSPDPTPDPQPPPPDPQPPPPDPDPGPAPACSFTVTPLAAHFGDHEDDGKIDVRTTSGCAWKASTNDKWIRLKGPTSGTGPGEVKFRVERNNKRAPRTGAIQVAGATVVVTQDGH